MSVLSVKSLGKSFGGVRAVENVSFEIGKGEFLALIGPNGAGKSTTFNMINGQLAPDTGEILIGDKSIAGMQPRDIWRLGRWPHFPGGGDFRLDDRGRERADGIDLARQPSAQSVAAGRVAVSRTRP
jgi:ABC-type branched-chain amino acid transport systems, ATPase component